MLTDGSLCLWSLLDICRQNNQECKPQILTQSVFAWRNLMEVTDNRIIFASERRLGDFHILNRLK